MKVFTNIEAKQYLVCFFSVAFSDVVAQLVVKRKIEITTNFKHKSFLLLLNMNKSLSIRNSSITPLMYSLVSTYLL